MDIFMTARVFQRKESTQIPSQAASRVGFAAVEEEIQRGRACHSTTLNLDGLVLSKAQLGEPFLESLLFYFIFVFSSFRKTRQLRPPPNRHLRDPKAGT